MTSQNDGLFKSSKSPAALCCVLEQDSISSIFVVHEIMNTVKPVLSDHSNIDKTKVLMTNGSLMKVESIAECSLWSILQYCIKRL